jgi:small conductance mechanosensitive channel
MGVIACLGLFGFNITSVAALVGAAGLTVGLAMQGSLSNLAAGIMLMLLRPFKIGDFVAVAGQIGRVDDLDLFNTKIDTPDNRRLIIPNGQVFGSTIENITHHPWRRAEVVLLLAYSYDQAVIRSALTQAAEGLSDRQPGTSVEVQMQAMGVNALEWAVRVWVPARDFSACRDRLIERVKLSLDQSGISIAHR